MTIRLFVCFALALLLGSQDAQAEKRVALVVGNSAYQNVGQLPNPANDAKAIAEMLKRADFEIVQAKINLGNLDFKRALREFTFAAKDADIAAVYFAGHGIEVKGTNYLIPVDAKLISDYDAEDEAVSVNRIIEALESAKRLRLVILDACRDNPFNKSMQRMIASRAVNSGLAKVEPPTTNTLIAFAARAGSTAEDGNGANSPFTAALLKHLTVPGRDIRIAFGYVRDDVMAATNQRQEPFVYGSLGGAALALVHGGEERKIDVVAPSDPNAAMRRDYELAAQLGTRDGWQSFLNLYKSGFFADLARGQLTKIDAARKAEVEAAAAKIKAEAAERAKQDAERAKVAEAERAKAAELARIASKEAAEKVKASDAAEKERLDAANKAKQQAKTSTQSQEDVSPTRPAAREKKEEKTKAAARSGNQDARSEQKAGNGAAAPSTGGRVSCNSTGCVPVASNCRIVLVQGNSMTPLERVLCP